MMSVLLACLAVIPLAVIMSMVGKGGGNFYVTLLLLVGISIHQAATSAQFMLMTTSAAAFLIYQKNKTVDWKLALVIDPPTDIMAFVGGYYAHKVGGTEIKIILVFLLAISGFFMLRRVNYKKKDEGKFGYWSRKFGEHEYTVNLWLALPVTTATGFVAGMVGISGGSFKIPLLVLACGVPMRIAVGTSSAMVAATALTGFLGHTMGGDLDPSLVLPLGLAALVGGLLGSRFSLETDPRRLKQIFAYTTLAAATLIAFKTLI